jgi:hypothetical protein
MSTSSKRSQSSTRFVPLRWALFGMVFAFGLTLLWFYFVGESLFSQGVAGPVTVGDIVLLVGALLGAAVGWWQHNQG